MNNDTLSPLGNVITIDDERIALALNVTGHCTAAHKGRCVRPSNHPIPSATKALRYGCVSIVWRSDFSKVAAVSRAVSAACP